MSVRNLGPETICSPGVNAALDTGDGGRSGQAIVWIHAAMYHSDVLAPCLVTGDLGVGAAFSAAGPKVERIRYQPQGFLPQMAAVKLSDVTLDNVTVLNATSSTTTVRGTMTNHSATAIRGASVYFFSMDDDRPLSDGTARTIEIAPGDHWDFTLDVDGPVGKYVAFPEYTSQ